jgi:hypothetical protein
LIGSRAGGLEGVERDVETMARALAAWQFELTRCLAGDATRDGILSAYQRLIDQTVPGDAVCVYYSGHGGRARNPYSVGPRYLQYLVPTDHEAEVFRGVMSFELSVLLARLTAKSPNVTVILDCCHAGQMSRGEPAIRAGQMTLKPKLFGAEPSEAQIKAFIEALRGESALADVESNPYALRLVATEPNTSAFEGTHGEVSSSLFTNALGQVLAERGARGGSWGSVMLEVRERVIAIAPTQRPDVEGPRRRQLWSTAQSPHERALALFFNGASPRLRGGALFGAAPGARFGVMPRGSENYTASASLAEAVVVAAFGCTSQVELQAPEHAGLSGAGFPAFPLGKPARACPVALGPELSPELGGLIANSRYVSPVEAEPGVAVPSVVRRGADLALRDAAGFELLRTPETRPAELIERLECLAQAEALRSFEPGLLRVKLAVELGRVVDGKCLKMAPDELLHVGDRQYVSVINRGSDSLFLAVLGIDAKYSVRLLSRRAPRGHLLRPNEPLFLGQDAQGIWRGFELSWPDALAASEPRLESILVIATDDSQDFPLLTTADAYDLKLAHQLQSPPETALRGSQQRGGDAEAPRPVGSEYALQRFDYRLSPTPRP